MRTTAIKRSFSYNNQQLGDPNPNLPPEQVKELFAAARPELASAVIEGPELVNGRQHYRFVKQVGTKG
jgi:PRTRC genetic system protein C